NNLPAEVRAMFPLKNESADELVFAHNEASFKVATSVRSGTIHRLHVSEFGKICRKYPDKAAEVITGSIPAMPRTGMIVIESTAEGRQGEFYNMVQRAMRLQDTGAKLNERDYKLHFFAWWMADEYAIDPAGVELTDSDREYFDKVEQITGW